MNKELRQVLWPNHNGEHGLQCERETKEEHSTKSQKEDRQAKCSDENHDRKLFRLPSISSNAQNWRYGTAEEQTCGKEENNREGTYGRQRPNPD